MSSCAVENCGRLECAVCSVNERFQEPEKCGKQMPNGRRCQVTGPHRDCRPGRKEGEAR